MGTPIHESSTLEHFVFSMFPQEKDYEQVTSFLEQENLRMQDTARAVLKSEAEGEHSRDPYVIPLEYDAVNTAPRAK